MDIQVTPDYKIVSDRLNITVRHCYMADPTKAPNWKEREAKVNHQNRYYRLRM